MARTKAKTVYVCSECGHDAAKWFGRCPSCNAWNTAGEFRDQADTQQGHWAKSSGAPRAEPVPLISPTDTTPDTRAPTGLDELDRVLGGGLCAGAVTLIGGDPGIGKSTLLLQVAVHLAQHVDGVLYVSGEESETQIRARAQRLEAESDRVQLLAETNVQHIVDCGQKLRPGLLIADSIQSLYHPNVPSAPGNVTQVRECAFELLRFAKETGIPVVVVGHVTKGGDVAGPRVLEHMVDAVLYLEGDRYHELRVMRAQKNRFGATTEIGLFEMTERGFRDVVDPSHVLLADRRPGVPGSAVAATLDGSRALLLEVQALGVHSVFSNPQQRSQGFAHVRLAVLLGVLRVRGGVDLSKHDVFVSVTGGMRVEETGIDLAVCLAVASSCLQTALPDDIVIIGEVGLGGECRRVAGGERRLTEAVSLGFERAVLPASMASSLAGTVQGIELVPVRDLRAAIDATIGSTRPAAADRA